MRIEDMKNWTVDQLKKEVVRLSEECEKRQHEILDLQEHQIELERDFTKTVEENRKAHEDLDRANKVISRMFNSGYGDVWRTGYHGELFVHYNRISEHLRILGRS